MPVKVWMINAMLAVCLVVIGVNTHRVWRTAETTIPEAAISPEPSEKADRIRSPQRQIGPVSMYRVIANKNLFASYRRELEFEPESVVEDPPQSVVSDLRASNEKVVLYGVIVLGDYRRALVLHSTATQRQDRQQKWVDVGDKLGALAVDRILADRIYLSGDSDRYELLLYDKGKDGTADAAGMPAAPSRARVIQASPSPPSKETAPSAAPGKPVAAPSVEKSDDALYETIDTPFGQIKRKIRN